MHTKCTLAHEKPVSFSLLSSEKMQLQAENMRKAKSLFGNCL